MPGATETLAAAARRERAGASGRAHGRPLAAPAVLLAGMALAFAAPGAAQDPESASPPAALSEEEMRGRERIALLAMSTVTQAEKMYAAANGSLYGEMRCLTHPTECLPGFDPQAASFLDPTYDWLEPRLGYDQKFHPGPKATDEQVRSAGAHPGSLTAFAFTVTPTVPGVSGRRAFCADSRGKMCVTPDGREPPVRNGRCDPCRKLD